MKVRKCFKVLFPTFVAIVIVYILFYVTALKYFEVIPLHDREMLPATVQNDCSDKQTVKVFSELLFIYDSVIDMK